MLAFAPQSLLRSAINAGSGARATLGSPSVDEAADGRRGVVWKYAARHNAHEHGRPEVRPAAGAEGPRAAKASRSRDGREAVISD
jgi:hypothetical protein